MELFWRRGAGWFVEGVERRGCRMGLQGARVCCPSLPSGKRADANHRHHLLGRWECAGQALRIVQMTARDDYDVCSACRAFIGVLHFAA